MKKNQTTSQALWPTLQRGSCPSLVRLDLCVQFRVLANDGAEEVV